MINGRPIALCLVLAFGLGTAACEQEKPRRSLEPSQVGGFDTAAADPYRPCTLVAIEDATQITGQPFYLTMTDNVVDGAQTTCSYAVGVGGLQGMVQVELFHGDKTMTPDAMFADACKKADGASAVVKTEIGASCVQKTGAQVHKIGEVVMAASVLGRWGEVDGPRSAALAARVAPRLKAALDAQ